MSKRTQILLLVVLAFSVVLNIVLAVLLFSGETIKGKTVQPDESLVDIKINNAEFDQEAAIYIFENCDPSTFIGRLPTEFYSIGAQFTLLPRTTEGICDFMAAYYEDGKTSGVRTGKYSIEKYNEIKKLIYSDKIQKFEYPTDENGSIVSSNEEYYVMLKTTDFSYIGIAKPSKIEEIMSIVHSMEESATER